MQADLIIVNEYCRICHIEPAFIFRLEEGGLIEIRIVEGEKFLKASQLHDIERYTRMYYDLSINFEGIDAIHHLLNRVQSMQQEIGRLQKKLKVYEADYFEENEL
ncbi:chaperone modulator CbpM [Parabacteroides gordonii]|uniref:chaperone modulator CbpM n=1 Tax=Parabacteroides gordonii TaxID=574930 RepID=UPI0026EF0F52|nr:chaperone modulator CbpM [Parabacteroides gordonii]